MTVKRGLVALSGLVVAVAAVSLAVAQNWGWATPFALPATMSYDGRSYYLDGNPPRGPTCFTSSPPASPRGRIYQLPKGYIPLRRVGDVFGYFTSSKPILLPHYEWTSRTSYVVLVRDGGCLRYFSLPGGG